MQSKRAGNGRRRRGQGKRSSEAQAPNGEAVVDSRAGGLPSRSRLLLTRILREDEIWEVYVATAPQRGTQVVTRLDFEGHGLDETVRYTRPLEGDLLEALQRGMPVSRMRLVEELDLAIREAAATTSTTTSQG